MPRGGYREGSGRKPLTLEFKARELTAPYIPRAIETLAEILENGIKDADRISAARLLFSYYWGQPQAFVDVTTDGDKITGVNVKILPDADSDD